MLIELQYRTHLQHLWATAVETYGLVTNQAIKASQGDDQALRLFAVASSLFALEEGCPTVPNTSDNRNELIAELKKIDLKIHILETLRAVRLAIDNIPSSTADSGLLDQGFR